MLSSSRSDEKQEARFAARLDVLMERVDTLASTVATTASAMAKKDGEIAALRRDLEARDQTLQALVAQARQATSPPAAGPSIDANELRSLRNAVAALTKSQAEGGHGVHVDQLAETVRTLGRRVDELSAAAAARPADRPPDELLSTLAALRSQVEALGELPKGVAEELVAERLSRSDDELAKLSQRLDLLAETVESATAGLGDKERELAALQRRFTDSSTRIESIVDDIREALHVFPSPSTSPAELAALSGRVDAIDQRVATVADEVSRAKTLWPVALRSLEARLEDAVSTQRAEPAVKHEDAGADPADDLLAGLRDSLQAMESVAAEMARASDTLGERDEESRVEQELEQTTFEPAGELRAPSALAAGATVVPFRASDP